MEPPLLCHQCSMKFNTINQLSKHRDKFCVGSFSQRIPKDNVYLLPDQRLADEKIRQLQALKVSEMGPFDQTVSTPET